MPFLLRLHLLAIVKLRNFTLVGWSTTYSANTLPPIWTEEGINCQGKQCHSFYVCTFLPSLWSLRNSILVGMIHNFSQHISSTIEKQWVRLTCVAVGLPIRVARLGFDMAGGEGVRQLRPCVESNRRKYLSIHVLICVAINSLPPISYLF